MNRSNAYVVGSQGMTRAIEVPESITEIPFIPNSALQDYLDNIHGTLDDLGEILSGPTMEEQREVDRIKIFRDTIQVLQEQFDMRVADGHNDHDALMAVSINMLANAVVHVDQKLNMLLDGMIQRSKQAKDDKPSE